MASIFGFLTSFGKEKLGGVGQSFTQMIVAWDPETASQAEIEEMIKELDKITIEAGKAKTEYDREQAEADAAAKNFARYMSAAELLNKQFEEANAAGNTAKANELGASLDKLMGELETLGPEVEREAREAEETKQFYEEIKQLAQMTAEKVKTARQQLDGARRQMQRAEIDKERAQQRAAKAEQLAGLRTNSSSLGIALAAMNKQTEEAKAKASASEMKARLLVPEQATEDSHIEAALQVGSGPRLPRSH
ncbi:MAG: hypothetical protein V2B18_14875 [Pseudomonadota bacterium]